MPYVELRDGESAESLITRFRVSVQRSGILRELKDRRFFRSKGEKARAAAQRALRAMRRRQRRQLDRSPSRPEARPVTARAHWSAPTPPG